MIYKEAAKILEDVLNEKGSLKSLVFGSSVENKKHLFAVVCETLKFISVIDTILEKTRLQKLERKLQPKSLAQVLVYDFLFGKGINGANKNLKESILKHKAALKSELARLKVKANVKRNEDLIRNTENTGVELPRYVRVNLLKTTVQDVVQHFRKEGYTQVHHSFWDYSSYLLGVGQLEARQFLCDPHVPDLLVFAPKTDLHTHVLYISGDIILQDKASCIPASVLAPPPGSHVVDACAAPGNKTTHAAALMANKGKIYAHDLDAKRLATMRTLCLKAGALCIDTIHKDFLKTDPTDPKLAKVEYLIVDPSCSGSGIVSRLDHLTSSSQPVNPERLRSLANFQAAVVKHALSFPAAKRVVYSTCSVHREENEMVVKEALDHCRNQFKLVKVLPDINSRGEPVFPSADCCLRLNPTKDYTNGFFVACFEKCDKSEVDDVQSNVSETYGETAGSSETVNEMDKIESSGKNLEKQKSKDSGDVIKTLAENSRKIKNKKKKRNRTEKLKQNDEDSDSKEQLRDSSNESRKRTFPEETNATGTKNKFLKKAPNETFVAINAHTNSACSTSKKKKKHKKKKHTAVTS